jgi:periplasmic copper chaperone A
MLNPRVFGMGAALAALLCVHGPAIAADDTSVGSLTIEHPWSRPTDSMAKTGIVYLVVKNGSGTPDRLVGAATQVAGAAEIHVTVNEGGMMRMKHVDAIEVPANGSATLKPGGFHIMLVDLKTQLKEGTAYPLTLTFEKAGAVTVRVQVQRPSGSSGRRGGGMGGAEPMHEGMDHMKH